MQHDKNSPAVQLARKLYERCPTPKPTWEQLSPNGPTQQTWIEQAERMIAEGKTV